MSRNKEHRGAAFDGRPIGSVFFVSAHLFLYIMNIYRYSLYIPYNIPYRYVLNPFHIVSFVCFVIYSVNSRSGHDRSQTVGQILHVLVSKLNS